MKHNLKISFFLKKSKEKKNGKSPIICRITINGNKTELSTQLEIESEKWNVNTGRVEKRSNEGKFINQTLDSIKMSLYLAYRNLHELGQIITPDKVKRAYTQIGRYPQTLLGFFKKHNDDEFKLIGYSRSYSTYKKYDLSYRRVKEFLKLRYRKEDIYLDNLSLEFIRDYEMFLSTEYELSHNTVFKMIQYIKKIVNLARDLGVIHSNPFLLHTIKWKHSDPKYLTHFELESIINRKINMKRLAIVRDIFVFSTFTGLAFIDVKQLDSSHLIADGNGALWIRKPRQKTGNMCNIPVIQPAKAILEKYEEHPECIKKNVLLPVLSNQKTNAYLKKIADLCGITKRMSSHTARHTAATTVFLANNVSIENVAKILGHSSTKMAQHYAKVLDSSILRDMQSVEAKFG